MSVRNKIACLLLLLAHGLNVNAQELTVSVSPSAVSVGDQLQVTFSLNATGTNFHAPSFPDFNILMGPSQSTSMQIINGSMSQSLSFTYVLQAVREGTFKIGSASIDAGGKHVSSNPFSITVTKGSGSAPQAGQQQGGQQGSQQQQGTVEVSKNVFLRTFIDKSSVYRGEGIVCSFKLYTRVTLINFTQKKAPAFNGFWSQDIDMAQQLEFHNETMEGVTYKVAEIKKMVLFPQRSGTLQIDPMEAEVIARVQVKRNRSNDPFDQFFNDPFFNNPFFGSAVQDVKVPLRSPVMTVNVKELPAAPAGFGGAVGKYSMEVTADKKEVKAHNPVTIRVKISGHGNLKLMDPPVITFPPDFETYDPKISSSLNATTQGVNGSKTFEYLVIPRVQGEYKVEINPLSYFNPETKQYQSVPAPDINLKVLKGEGGEAATSTVSGFSKEDVQLLGKDIRYIKTGKSHFNLATNTIYPSPLFYALSISPAFLFAGLVLLRRKQEKDRGNAGLLRSRQAGRVARRRLARAKKLQGTGQSAQFLDEMSRALWGYISDRLQIPVAHLSRENVSLELGRRGVADPVITEFLAVLDDCETARFAPAGLAKSPAEIYDKGFRVITGLEENKRA